MCRARSAPVVCVTGANGFLGSEIVKQCLLMGYRVRATVRNAADLRKTQHLRKLAGATTNLEILSAEMGPETSIGFGEAIAGCSAVFHTASPFSGGKISKEDVHTAVFGTLAILRACEQAGVKTVIMTSSMCAAMPESDGNTFCETNWSDPQLQVQHGNTYAASKILAERAAWEMVRKENPNFRLVTILPATIVGPGLRNDLGFTNRLLLSMMKSGWPGNQFPDESLSFVDVRDCAAHHIAAMEQETASGRYFSAAHSMHWNEIGTLLKEINPKAPMAKCCSDPCDPTSIDRTRQDDLGVHIRELPEILCDAAQYFRKMGVQDALNFVDMAPSGCSVQVLACRRADPYHCVSGKRSSILCMNPWLAFTQCDDSGH